MHWSPEEFESKLQVALFGIILSFPHRIHLWTDGICGTCFYHNCQCWSKLMVDGRFVPQKRKFKTGQGTKSRWSCVNLVMIENINRRSTVLIWISKSVKMEMWQIGGLVVPLLRENSCIKHVQKLALLDIASCSIRGSDSVPFLALCIGLYVKLLTIHFIAFHLMASDILWGWLLEDI